MTCYLAGVPVNSRSALAATLRREFFIEGKPLLISPEDIQRKPGRAGSGGWWASAQVKHGRRRHPISVASKHPVELCARTAIRLEWTAPNHVVIHAAQVDSQPSVG